jgi:hypothetical protein
MTIHIEWQDQFGWWHHCQTEQNQADVHLIAQSPTIKWHEAINLFE